MNLKIQNINIVLTKYYALEPTQFKCYYYLLNVLFFVDTCG